MEEWIQLGGASGALMPTKARPDLYNLFPSMKTKQFLTEARPQYREMVNCY